MKKVLLYADDTVLYTSSKNLDTIEENLNIDLEVMSQWFDDNDLLLNLKKGKTEFTIFGSQNKLSKARDLEIYWKQTLINYTPTYEYLGVIIDKSLTYVAHSARLYKRISSRIKLLKRIRNNLTPFAAESVYKMMIQPLMFYCSNIFLGRLYCKLQLLQDQAIRIIQGSRSSKCKLRPIKDEFDMRSVIEMFKCINNLNCSLFENYFKKQEHQKNTRGNGSLIKLHSVRTEMGRKTFKFFGALNFNKLPHQTRVEQSLVKFKAECKQFYAF